MNIQINLRLCSIAALTAVSMVAAQAQNAPKEPELKSLKLVTTSDVQIGGPWIIARDKNYFSQEGLSQIEVKQFATAPTAFPAFVSGEVQVMTHADQPMFSLAGGNVPIKLIAVYSDMTGLHGMLANSQVKTAKDLEGKKLGVQKGTVMEVYAGSFCKAYGCDLAKIQIINMTPPDAVAALVEGSIDAWAGWQPFIKRALDAGKSKGIHVLHYGNISHMPAAEGPKKLHSAYAVFYVSQAFDEKYPATLGALVRVLDKSLEFMKKEPLEAAKILATEFKIPVEEARSQMADVKYDLALNNENVGALQETADRLSNSKLIKTPVDVGRLLDMNPLKSVRPSAATFKQ
jgi:NitT/TauT family transport system substrate-binding protein